MDLNKQLLIFICWIAGGTLMAVLAGGSMPGALIVGVLVAAVDMRGQAKANRLIHDAGEK